MLTKNYYSTNAGRHLYLPRVRFVALAAAMIGACNVGGIRLSSHFGTERNLYGKLLLGLCMIIVPLFHPQWRSRDRREARNAIADICVAWLLGLGAETAYLVSFRPAGLRLFDVVVLAGVSIALAAVSIGVAGAAAAMAADVRRIVTHQAVSSAGVGGPYTALSTGDEPRMPMNAERWLYATLLILPLAAIAAWEIHRRQYLFGVGAVAFCVMFSLMIAAPPAGGARRLSIYACLLIGCVPMVKQMVFG